MNVVAIRDEAGLQQLRPMWEQLLGESASSTIFLTPEWLLPWWQAYGKPGELWVLAAFDSHGTLRGLAPLRRQTRKKYGFTYPALVFLGDGSNDSDYLDFLIASGYEEQVMAAFEDYWRKEMESGTILLLNEIPETSPNLPILMDHARKAGRIVVEEDVPCGTVRLPEQWDEYLGILRPRFRTKLRSVMRDLDGRGGIRFGFCSSAQQAESLLPVMFDLHTRRWVRDGRAGVFGWDPKRDFYAKVSPSLLERGWLRFSWLEWNDRILACQYGFVYRDTYFQLQEGYEPASEHWSVGIGLRAWSIREFQKEGVREYDFLGGIGRHKSDWGAGTKLSKKLVVAGTSYRNRLFCNGPAWEERARERVKKMVPEKLLTARKERLERSAREALKGNHSGAESSERGGLRAAAASAYFHLKLPALARPVRDQYQLSMANGGRVPKLLRRRQASGRILYYHRVNDEKDPFFPAISSTLFEQEMRFVAQHYKVVSLEEMVARLEQGSPEPVVAITFDDGYQDNYHTAFPILKRYGLPATIFLTTGTMNGAEPLWFERLALAVKKTGKEYIDLEIDIPRRFWMRTEAERLAANGGIFTVLKNLPDPERRERLVEVLKLLGSAEEGERWNKMLTWDQVRQMKAHRIDFGGHTVTHPFLSKMSREEVAWEAAECKRHIEEELQLPVLHFAYPNGREEDFGAWNKEVIRSAGYSAAVTTMWGLNYRSTDPMELRRGGPWEESQEMFAYKLDWYQLVNE